jgi:aromatic ring-opening dioxygenase catalytic subunit (LigB family)
MKRRHKALFLSHGGGPLPLLGDEGHREMVACLSSIATTIQRPAAIIMVSAHWEEDISTITSGVAPPLLYDYYGFPEESYEIKYPYHHIQVGQALRTLNYENVLIIGSGVSFHMTDGDRLNIKSIECIHLAFEL